MLYAAVVLAAPGGVAVPPRLLATGVGGVQRVFCRGHLVASGIETGVRLLERGLRGGERVLGGVQPGAQLGQLPDRLAAGICPVGHKTILPARRHRRPPGGLSIFARTASMGRRSGLGCLLRTVTPRYRL